MALQRHSHGLLSPDVAFSGVGGLLVPSAPVRDSLIAFTDNCAATLTCKAAKSKPENRADINIAKRAAGTEATAAATPTNSPARR